MVNNRIAVLHHHLSIFSLINRRQFIPHKVTIESNTIDARIFGLIMCPNEVFATSGFGVVFSFSGENEDNQRNGIAINKGSEIHPLLLSQI